jgi:hypothetical protein
MFLKAVKVQEMLYERVIKKRIMQAWLLNMNIKIKKLENIQDFQIKKNRKL